MRSISVRILLVAEKLLLPVSIAAAGYLVQSAIMHEQIAEQEAISQRQNASAQLTIAFSVLNNPRSDKRIKQWAITVVAEVTHVDLGQLSALAQSSAKSDRKLRPSTFSGFDEFIGPVTKSLANASSAEAAASAGCTDLETCMATYFSQLRRTEHDVQNGTLSLKGSDYLRTDQYSLQPKK